MPDLVGLPVPLAREVGHDAAVVVVAADLDGPPLGALSWPGVHVVTAQDPAAGTLVASWDVVRIAFRRADGDAAGDREPRPPPPDPGELEAEAAPGDA